MMRKSIRDPIINGLYNVYKPKGWTSFDVVNWIRKKSGVKRVGHAGTLDPLATGVLLVAVGREFTSGLDAFLTASKVYRADILFGVSTDSYDLEGLVVTMKQVPELTREMVEEALHSFRGLIQQMPPMFSAKKVNGKKLYELARKGEEIEREAVEVDVKSLEVLSWESGPYPVIRCVMEVSKGTYVRAIAHDLGQKLGCGAVLSNLERMSVGPYKVEDAVGII